MKPSNPDLGPCCACEATGPTVRNVIMWAKKSPTPGKGWGCFVCGLPADGATIVLCDDCLDQDREPRFACVGYPGSDGRIPVEALQDDFHHDLKLHRFLLKEHGRRQKSKSASAARSRLWPSEK